MPAVPFRPWPLGDILHIAALRLNPVQVGIQRRSDKSGGSGPVRRGQIVLILKQLLGIREIFQHLYYQLPLLLRDRAGVCEDLHAIPLCDIFQVSGSAAAFEVTAFLYEPCHPLPLPVEPQRIPEGEAALRLRYLTDAVAAELAV